MNARELRLGNKIYFIMCDSKDQNMDEKKEITIYDDDMTYMLNNESLFEPIPLTEEWLLKFGFEKNGRDWELPNFRFHVNKPINYNGFVFCDGYTVITEKIQYVHQLQNLYFALTGAELTVP